MTWKDALDNRRLRHTVLIVEDNQINRDLLRCLLEDDFDILEAENGLVGLAQLEQHYQDISLILLDVYMPECDGFDFLRRKREDERYDAVPVIVTTMGGGDTDEIACLQLGANDFVLKPYDAEILRNRVNNMVRLRESASIVNQLMWDKLTGLYSKEFFYRAVEDAYAAEPDREYDLVCSDLDNFKALNDRYGEEFCDVLLHDLAQRLTGILPDLVAGGRIGGDLFAFLVEHQPAGWEEALLAAGEGLPIANPNLKFGVVESVDRGMTVPKACSRAISAIETLKGRLGVGVAFFDEAMNERMVMEQAIRDSMHAALEGGQFTVYYQPKHDVRADAVGGAEALVRWIHPELGFISPGVFIPVFERNGFITNLDLYVWEETCREIRRCIDLGLPVVPVSVNASRLDFDMPDLTERLQELADRYGIDHALLHVELTETAYSDSPEAVVKTLKSLKACGFSAELDDFGSGYSSLVSLNTLPLDVMKLDMSMIRQASELDDFRIVEATIRLAQTLDLKTVVEGVETAEEAQRVTGIGCEMIQGYFFSKPLSQAEFEEFLQQWR